MAPEYGATMGFFPVDEETLRYLIGTGRSEEQVELVARYCKEQRLFRTDDTPDPEFTDTLELDMSTVKPALAGPKRPQDRVDLDEMKAMWTSALTAPVGPRGFGLAPEKVHTTVPVTYAGRNFELKHGDVVIAAITSCTNTSNPSVMVAAGLLAKKAVERGLDVKPWVKTSMAPGSKVVTTLPGRSGADPLPGSAQLPHGRLWLHHLHRQQRPAARADQRRHQAGRPGGGRRALAATATLRAASAPTCAPTSWPRRRWWSPMPLPAPSISTWTASRLGYDPNGNPVFLRTSGRARPRCAAR